MSEPDHADVVTKPPLIYLAGVLLGLWLAGVFPLPFPVAWPERGWIGTAIAACAGVLAAWGVVTFRRAGEGLDPHSPTFRIMSDGPFRYTRNPLYVAMALVQVALGLLLGNAWIPLLLAPVLALMTWGVILREERYLERKFGEEYLKYKRTVRRWL